MAKHTRTVRRSKALDFGSWNFIIFLTLSLILMVVLLSAMKKTALDVRIRAGLTCPNVSTNLPRPEDCPGGQWIFGRDYRGCPSFTCKQ